MKLSHVFAKLTSVSKSANIKRNALRALSVGTLAGAALLAATPAAQAQHFAADVRISGPHVYAPAPRPIIVERRGFYGGGFYGPRYDGWREHEVFVRHEDFRFRHGYEYGRR